MGILNVTPDSFSDGGIWMEVGEAMRQAHHLVAEGADILDIGGESTRPGSTPVSAEEELARVLPVIRRLKRELPATPVSIDTYKAEVAAAAIDAGADLVNDVWGLKFGLGGSGESSPMAHVVADRNCPVILMHNRSTRSYTDFWSELLADLQGSIALARQAGIEDRQIWLDPGFGFGKEPRHNLEVLKHLERVTSLGFPVLLGTSRKSTLGLVLERPAGERIEGTAATSVWGISRGCHMLRLHEVGAIRPYVKMADAIAQGIHFNHG
jgi:dihydropteroate synthase